MDANHRSFGDQRTTVRVTVLGTWRDTPAHVEVDVTRVQRVYTADVPRDVRAMLGASPCDEDVFVQAANREADVVVCALMLAHGKRDDACVRARARSQRAGGAASVAELMNSVRAQVSRRWLGARTTLDSNRDPWAVYPGLMANGCDTDIARPLCTLAYGIVCADACHRHTKCYGAVNRDTPHVLAVAQNVWIRLRDAALRVLPAAAPPAAVIPTAAQQPLAIGTYVLMCAGVPGDAGRVIMDGSVLWNQQMERSMGRVAAVVGVQTSADGGTTPPFYLLGWVPASGTISLGYRPRHWFTVLRTADAEPATCAAIRNQHYNRLAHVPEPVDATNATADTAAAAVLRTARSVEPCVLDNAYALRLYISGMVPDYVLRADRTLVQYGSHLNYQNAAMPPHDAVITLNRIKAALMSPAQPPPVMPAAQPPANDDDELPELVTALSVADTVPAPTPSASAPSKRKEPASASEDEVRVLRARVTALEHDVVPALRARVTALEAAAAAAAVPAAASLPPAIVARFNAEVSTKVGSAAEAARRNELGGGGGAGGEEEDFWTRFK